MKLNIKTSISSFGSLSIKLGNPIENKIDQDEKPKNFIYAPPTTTNGLFPDLETRYPTVSIDYQ
ncbi:MAG TPA: hypothetical protein PK728_04505 [Bacillota bacterium]|nr:hypothetical protein [Bacillota bacterium]